MHELGGELSLSVRVVGVTPELRSARRRARPTDPTHRRGRAVPARADRRLRAPRSDRAKRSVTTCARHAVAAAAPYADAAEFVARPRHDRPSRSPRTAPRRIAAGRLRHLRRAAQSSASTWRRSTCASTAACTSRWSPSCSRAGARRAGYLDLPETERAAACCSTSYRARAAAALAVPRLQRAGRSASCAFSMRPRSCSAASAPTRCRTHIISKHRRRQRPAGGRAAAQGSGPARAGRRRHASQMNIVPLFETIDDLRGCGAIMDELLQLCRVYRALLDGRGNAAGSDARLFGQQQGRRLPDVQLGAVQGRGRAGASCSRGTASGCACSTAAAARSAAAADRATRRSSRSRRAAWPARSASPSRARSSPASTPTPTSAGATSRRWLRPRSRPRCSRGERARGRTRRTAKSWTALSARRASAPTASSSTRRRASSSYFPHRDADQRDRRAEHRQPARLAHGVRSHRGPARDPVGVQLVACRASCCRAGTVSVRRSSSSLRRRRATRAWRCCRRCTASGRSSSTLLVEHGHGAGQGRPRASRRATRSWSPTRRFAAASSAASRPRCSAPFRRVLAITGQRSCSRAIRCWRAASATAFPTSIPLNHLQVELLRRFRAGETDERIKRAIHLTHQRHRRRAAQQRLTRCRRRASVTSSPPAGTP